MSLTALLNRLTGNYGWKVYVHPADYQYVVAMLADEEFRWVPVDESEFIKKGNFILRAPNREPIIGKLNDLIRSL